jgi:hypothetical protein
VRHGARLRFPPVHAIGQRHRTVGRVEVPSPRSGGFCAVYSDCILGDGPSVYYRLGEASGPTAHDSSGNGNDGTYQFGVSYGAAGAINGEADAAIFGGTDNGDAVTASSAALPGGSSARTVEFWVCCQGYPTVSWGGFSVSVNSPTIQVSDPTASVSVNAPYNILGDGQWHLIGATYASGEVTIYVDGQSLTTAALAGVDTPTNGDLDIGFTDGGLDEVAIYPSALTPSGLDTHWTVGGSTAGPCQSASSSSSYAQTILASAPSRYYRLGDLSADPTDRRVAFDDSGHCANGAYNSITAPQSTGAVINDPDGSITAPLFTGDQQALVWASAAGLPGGSSARTVEFWVSCQGYPTVSWGGFSVSVDFHNGTIQVSDPTASTTVQFPAVCNAGLWHFVAATYEGGTATIYVDGQPTGGGSLPGVDTATDGQKMEMGFTDGDVDEVAIYPSALSVLDIYTHWYRAKYGQPGDFIAGKVEIAGSPVQGAHVQACPIAGGSCFQGVGPTDSGGHFAIPVPAGTYAVTALAPAAGETAKTVGPVTVPPSTIDVIVDFPAQTLPPGATFDGYGPGETPTVFWGSPSTLTVPGCAGGFGVVFVHSTNTTTAQPETLAFSLTETPSGSGSYVANLPPLAPLHGDASVEPLISCPGQTNLLPDGGDPGGGTAIAITGSAFTGATAVKFGPNPASSFTVVNDHVISAVSPPGAGTVPVTVTTGSGSQVVGHFEYFAVTGLNPTSGPASGGTSVTISGEGFTHVEGVVFGLAPASSFSVISPTEIQAVAPPGVGTVDVQVLNGFAVSDATSASLFSYTGGPPWSSSINEGTGSDAPMTLATQMSGGCAQSDYASGQTGIDFGILCRYAYDQIAGITGNGPIGVLFQAFVTAAVAFGAVLLGLPLGPVILGVTIGFFAYQLLGLCSGGCHIFGLFIDPSGSVVDTTGNPIGGATATLLHQEGSSFLAVDPSGGAIDPAQNPETTGIDGAFEWEALADTYEVRASASDCHAPGNPSRPSVTTAPFVIPPPAVGLLLTLECPGSTPPTPTVTGLSTTLGPAQGGNRVEIVGTGLAKTTEVDFGSVSATGVVPLSPSAVAAIAPAGASTVDVTVTTPGGTSAMSSADLYTYVDVPSTPGAPTISSLKPASGPTSGGTTVAIRGSNLDGVWSVSFAGVPAVQVTDVSTTEVDAVTPSSLVPGQVHVTVVGPHGTSDVSSSDVFRYTTPPLTPPSLSLASVKPGAVGQGGIVELLVQGSGFQPDATLSISGTGVTLQDVRVMSTTIRAALRVDVDAPTGPRDVMVANPGGGSVTCLGCLTIDPGPKPTSTAPDTGARGATEDVHVLGTDFVGGATVRFGSGHIVVNSVTFVDPTELVVNITIRVGAKTGPRTIRVVNPDAGRGSCPNCFTVT